MVKVFDCTLRDGLHITDFTDECIISTVLAAEKTKIDFIEVGYKMPKCIKPTSTKLVVMVDAKNIQPVDKRADFVRVACYPEQIETAIKAVEDFKKQGFGVFLHLMTADKFEKWDLLTNWDKKDILESLYFADTFGALMPEDVEKIYKKLKNIGFKNISFHAHNNLQQAFANTLKAIELGAYSVDATVFGIGRGGGNLPIEVLLKYLRYDNQHYLELIKNYYIELKKNYNWGYSYNSLIGGLKNIHPSKVKAIE